MSKVLFITLSPPVNDCGVRVLMYRHLIERHPFDLRVITNDRLAAEKQGFDLITPPRFIRRVRDSRLHQWGVDLENLLWPMLPNPVVDALVRRARPEVVLTVADTSLCHIAMRAARRWKLPLAAFFPDWFPVMDAHYGHGWTRGWLSRRFRRFYARCDLAFCISDGMRAALGPHPNAHVLYPISGQHGGSPDVVPPRNGRFRLVYVGSVERFYGRMISSLLEKMMGLVDLEFIVVGPNADWPAGVRNRARETGAYLGFKPPEQAAAVLRGADALLVVMSFEEPYRLFMETSFNTKFADYCALGKPIVFWGPAYSAPLQVVRGHGGALVVSREDPDEVVAECRRLAREPSLLAQLANQAASLRDGLFNPHRLQNLLVAEIEKLGAPDGDR